MERLTTWRSDKRAAIANKDGSTPIQQTMKIPGVIDRLAEIEDILGDDYDLDRLRELVEADRDGRCKIFPVCKGKNCGTCGHFRRIPETRRGTCAVRPFSTDRWGGKKRLGFEPVQSHIACGQYVPALKGAQHG